MKSLLLIDSVLASLESLDRGQAVSARKVSRTVGEDVFRVADQLKALHAKGVVRCRQAVDTKNPGEKPYDLYTPIPSKVKAMIALRSQPR